MSADIVISVEKVSKTYRIWDSPASRLTSPVQQGLASLLPERSSAARWLRSRATTSYRDFWALNDVSFDVKKGEAVGIIGRNGSGKSTILQIISSTLQTTEGKVKVKGRVAALLELGSGFNPDFTGRENVFLNAAVLGFTKADTEAIFDEIVAFADIGDFIEQPVKTYSSGMMVRLAFAVQTSVNPDILIVDEALSVGDFFFQQKCFRRMAEMRAQGMSLLFVSHDMGSVRDLCSRAVYLRQGKVEFFGDSQPAIAHYFREGSSTTVATGTPLAVNANVGADQLTAALRHAIWIPNPITESPDAPAELLAVEVLDGGGLPTLKHRMGATALIRGYFRAHANTSVHVALEIKNRQGQMVSSLSSRVQGLAPITLREGQTWCFETKLQLGLEAGLYSFQLCLGHPHSQPNVGLRFAESPWLGPMTIDWDYMAEPAPFLGMFNLPASIAVQEVR